MPAGGPRRQRRPSGRCVTRRGSVFAERFLFGSENGANCRPIFGDMGSHKTIGIGGETPILFTETPHILSDRSHNFRNQPLLNRRLVDSLRKVCARFVFDTVSRMLLGHSLTTRRELELISVSLFTFLATTFDYMINHYIYI